MENLVDKIFGYLLTGVSPVVVIFLLIFLKKDLFDKWIASIGYALNRIGGIFKFFHKTAVQLDLQGSINDYIKKVSKDIPTLETQKVKVEYVDNNMTRSSFLASDNVILRLRRDDSNDANFVHGAFLFVSTSMLYKVKRYISLSQRDALDLYVTTKVIEKEKPNRVDLFLEQYLHPKLGDETSDRKKYFDQLGFIDEGGLFYPVLLEELNCLGSKVFGNRQDDQIILEVKELIGFLEKISQRKIGDDFSDLTFQRTYCKSAIVIIGKSTTILLEDTAPYTKYIRNYLYTHKFDTIYVLGDKTKKEVIDSVCAELIDIYDIIRSSISKSRLHFTDGHSRAADTYIVLLQNKNVSIYVHGSTKKRQSP